MQESVKKRVINLAGRADQTIDKRVCANFEQTVCLLYAELSIVSHSLLIIIITYSNDILQINCLQLFLAGSVFVLQLAK